MAFQTYGPFEIPMKIELKSDELARQFTETRSGLNEAAGVYIFIDRERHLPVYVGEAHRNSFGTRLSAHLNGARNSELRSFLNEQAEKVEVLLLALEAQDGTLPRAEMNSDSDHRLIHDLERTMIAVLSRINPTLCNIRH